MKKDKNKMSLMRTGYPADVTKEEKLTVLTPEHAEIIINTVKNMVEDGELIADRDYRTASDTGKRYLLYTGAQRIAARINFADDQTIINKTENPPLKTHGNSKKKNNGYWSYDVKSKIYHRFTNEILDTCLGSCNSSEKGLGEFNSNYILKMAGKRAYIGAVIKAAKCANLFDIDINLPEEKLKKIKATNGTINAPRFCPSCKTHHIIKGMWLIESVEHNKYVAEVCTKLNKNHEELMMFSDKDLLSKILSAEEIIFGNIKIPECKAEIMKQRKMSVSNKVLSLTKLESKLNKKENLVRYLLLLTDKVK